MRIAVLSCFYPYRGGIAQFNASLLGELGRNNEVRAFNFTRQYPDILFPGKTQKVTPDDEAVPVESTALLDTANPFTWLKTARIIRQWDPDVLVLRYWMSWFAPSLGHVASRMKKKCKVIGILDNVIPHERHFFDAPLTKLFLRQLDGAVTMCSEVAGDLTELRPGIRYIIHPHPLYSHFGEKLDRNEAERALGIAAGKRNLLFFGLIREYKGLDILIEAFGQLSEDYQLLIAGEPYGSFEKYRKLIDASPGKDRIHVYPVYIRDSEVKTYFSAADLTVQPYRSATQSGVSSISYHFEVPMVVTDVGGLKETVGDTGTGLVAAEVTAESVRHEIERYFADASVKEGCIEGIRKEKERLSWERFGTDLIKFAEEL